MPHLHETVQLKSSLSGDTKTVPFRAFGEVVEIRDNACKVKFPQGEFYVPADKVQPAPKHRCGEQEVQKYLYWFKNCGGIAIWDCADLEHPGISWTAPLNDASGHRLGKPNPYAGQITRIITNSSEVVVESFRMVDFFPVEIENINDMGQSGKMVDLSEKSTQKLREALCRARQEYGDASYRFDYEEGTAIVLVPAKETPLTMFQMLTADPTLN